MKEIKIPFSLTEYQKGGYEVETRGSEVDPPYKARILCTDFMSEGKTIVTANKSMHYENSNNNFSLHCRICAKLLYDGKKNTKGIQLY